MKNTIDPNKIYTVPQVAEILGIHPETLKRYIREGKIRAKRIGHGYKILGQEIINIVSVVS